MPFGTFVAVVGHLFRSATYMSFVAIAGVELLHECFSDRVNVICMQSEEVYNNGDTHISHKKDHYIGIFVSCLDSWLIVDIHKYMHAPYPQRAQCTGTHLPIPTIYTCQTYHQYTLSHIPLFYTQTSMSTTHSNP